MNPRYTSKSSFWSILIHFDSIWFILIHFDRTQFDQVQFVSILSPMKSNLSSFEVFYDSNLPSTRRLASQVQYLNSWRSLIYSLCISNILRVLYSTESFHSPLIQKSNQLLPSCLIFRPIVPLRSAGNIQAREYGEWTAGTSSERLHLRVLPTLGISHSREWDRRRVFDKKKEEEELCWWSLYPVVRKTFPEFNFCQTYSYRECCYFCHRAMLFYLYSCFNSYFIFQISWSVFHWIQDCSSYW